MVHLGAPGFKLRVDGRLALGGRAVAFKRQRLAVPLEDELAQRLGLEERPEVGGVDIALGGVLRRVVVPHLDHGEQRRQRRDQKRKPSRALVLDGVLDAFLGFHWIQGLSPYSECDALKAQRRGVCPEEAAFHATTIILRSEALKAPSLEG